MMRYRSFQESQYVFRYQFNFLKLYLVFPVDIMDIMDIMGIIGIIGIIGILHMMRYISFQVTE